MPGNVSRAPTKPLLGERWLECPITGLRFAECDGIWSRGQLVHPLAFDAPGYREFIQDQPPDASPNPRDVGMTFDEL